MCPETGKKKGDKMFEHENKTCQPNAEGIVVTVNDTFNKKLQPC